MRRTKTWLWLTSALLAAVLPLQAGEIGPLPRTGGAASFVDVTAQGEVLEVDYVARTARTLGWLQWDRPVLWQGWVMDRGESGLFLLLEPTGAKGTFGRIHAYTAPAPELEKSSLLLDLDDDYAILPVSAALAYVQYLETGTGQIQRFAFDPSANAVVGSFDFPISHRTIHAVRTGSGRLLLADPLSSRILVVDAKTHQVVEAQDAAARVGAGSGDRVFVKALTSGLVLVTRKFPEQDTTRLYLLDADTWRVVAESEALPSFTGEFFLEPAGGHPEIACVEETVRRGLRRPSGAVKVFETEGRRLVLSREISFDPDREIVLRAEGVFRVHPRYSFDYLSAKSLGREIFARLGTRFESPELLRSAYDQITGEFKEAGGGAATGGRVQLTRVP